MIDGFRYFGYAPIEGQSDTEMARKHTEVFLDVLKGKARGDISATGSLGAAYAPFIKLGVWAEQDGWVALHGRLGSDAEPQPR